MEKERYLDGVKTTALYSDKEGTIIDIEDNKEYIVLKDKKTGILFYIKNYIKHYIIWG